MIDLPGAVGDAPGEQARGTRGVEPGLGPGVGRREQRGHLGQKLSVTLARLLQVGLPLGDGKLDGGREHGLDAGGVATTCDRISP